MRSRMRGPSRLAIVGIVLIAAPLLLSCTAEEKAQVDAAAARLRESALVAFAEEHLSEQDLAAAVPADYELVDVNRNGFERHRKPWITVGAKLEGPVPFARVIFYVHPDSAGAHEEFERQRPQGDEGVPGDESRPWSLRALDLPNYCSQRIDDLFWCHAYKGSVHLVLQSSAGWPAGREVTREEREAAEQLLRAFGEFLHREVPE